MDNSSSSGNPVSELSDVEDIDPQLRRRSRIKLLVIFAMFAVPLLLASIYLHVVRTSGGALGDTSRGQLIHPAVPLEPFELQADSEPFNLESVQGLWTLLYMPEGACEEVCQRNLYHMKQVRLALNHRMTRVQRAVLVESESQLDSALLEEHVGLYVLQGNPEAQTQLREQIFGAQAQMEPMSDAVYLIDPFGNLMLRFSPDLEPQKMLKDLKHLLKVSRIG